VRVQTGSEVVKRVATHSGPFQGSKGEIIGSSLKEEQRDIKQGLVAGAARLWRNC
jgi:hypothetical protein